MKTVETNRVRMPSACALARLLLIINISIINNGY